MNNSAMGLVRLKAKSEQLLPEAVVSQESMLEAVKSSLLEPIENAVLTQDAGAFMMLLSENATVFLPPEPSSVSGFANPV